MDEHERCDLSQEFMSGVPQNQTLKVYLESFASGLPNFPVSVAQHAHQTFQQLWKVLQHVNVWYTGQDADQADQKLPFVGVDNSQILSQLGDELVKIQSVACRYNVLQ